MTRVVFLGTPDAAVPTLAALARRHDVGLVVTQPDRPAGRSGTPRPSPVKEATQSRGLSIAQPETGAELHQQITEHAPFDVGVVVAYGRILAPEVLDIPESGMVNVHFSLLPRWRGAAPVNRALMEGDSMTGVTIIKLDEGLDTGPVVNAQAIDIRQDENAGKLTDRLARLGANLLLSTLDRYLTGDLEPIAQSDEGATYASKITKEDRLLSVESGLRRFLDKVRGLAPVPGATLLVDGDPHKVLAAEASDEPVLIGRWEARHGWPVVGVADGAVRVTRIQPPGRNEIAGDDWVRGRHADGGTAG